MKLLHIRRRVTEAMRLDSLLRRELPAELGTPVSHSKIRRLIVAGAVCVNGAQCRSPAFLLRPGCTVEAAVDEERFFFERQPDDIDFTLTERDVLYEDNVLIAVNKPAFLPTERTVVEGRGNLHRAVIDFLWKRNPALRNPPYAGIMHRLDRETSGVILFTKSRTVNAAVHALFEQHVARKQYRAVCVPRRALSVPGRFSVQGCIGRLSRKSAACMMGELPPERGGLPAYTDFVVAAEQGGVYYIDCFPRTGRTHQIRVHLSQRGLPIAGDTLYGGTDGFAACGNRIMLHAARLEFPHPLTGVPLCVEAPLPDGFRIVPASQ